MFYIIDENDVKDFNIKYFQMQDEMYILMNYSYFDNDVYINIYENSDYLSSIDLDVFYYYKILDISGDIYYKIYDSIDSEEVILMGIK